MSRSAMSRTNMSRLSRTGLMPIVISTLAIGLATSGCSSLGFAKNEAPGDAGKLAAAAEKHAQKGDYAKALGAAEAAVAASPDDAALRVTLAQHYMQLGRFASAEASFAEALAIEDSPRTALNLALAKIGNGRIGDGLQLIEKYRGQLPASDYGLALALAGESERAVLVLGDAVRESDATARTRQNLAFALAMEGRWMEAKVVAGQDMPFANVGNRMGQWATFMQAGSPRQLIAGIMNTPLVNDDPGMPVRLARSTNPAEFGTQMAAAPGQYDPAPLAQYAPQPVAMAEAAAGPEGQPEVMPEAALADTAPVEAAPAPLPIAEAIAAPRTPYKVSVAIPAVKPSTVKTAAIGAPRKVTSQAEADQLVAKARQSSGLAVQLGAFSSMGAAKSAWTRLSAKHRTLRGYTPSYAAVTVKGRNYVRLAANGIADKRVGWALCQRVTGSASVCAQRQISNTQLQLAGRTAPKAHGKQVAAR